MRRNKLYIPIILIIIIAVFCTTLSSCITDDQIDRLAENHPMVLYIFVARFAAILGFIKDVNEPYYSTGEYPDYNETKDRYDNDYYDGLLSGMQKNFDSNQQLDVVGTNDNFKPATSNTNKEGNPNATLGEIGGQGKPEVTSVTLHGYVTGLEAHPLTITIFFTTGAVDGSFYHSAEGNCLIWDRDNKGNMIPGTKKEVYARYEFKGKITGWLNLKTYAVTGNMTCTGSIVYKGKVYPVNEPGKVSGYLDKKNNLSCTVDNGYTITASP